MIFLARLIFSCGAVMVTELAFASTAMLHDLTRPVARASLRRRRRGATARPAAGADRAAVAAAVPRAP